MSAYILTVDDEFEIRKILQEALIREGYEVGQAASGTEALALLDKRRPDLLVLDISMPGVDGLTVCRRLRADDRFATMPILFLTALSSANDVIEGLDAGGDDYIAKPLELPVFLARVRALLRRTQASNTPENEQDVLKVGQLSLNPSTYRLHIEDRAIQLTATEFRLMRYMMENANQPLSPQHLLEAVWEYPPYTGDPDLVRVHVRNLRAKVESGSGKPRYIQTVHGLGYTLQGS